MTPIASLFVVSVIGSSFTYLYSTSRVPVRPFRPSDPVCWSVPMTTSKWRSAARRLSAPALCLVAVAMIAPAMIAGTAPAAEPLVVVMDRARLVKMPDGVATVVVGNPLIADVSIQSGGMMVLTGKGYGITNLMLLDRGGKVLLDTAVEVQGAPDTVVVYRGANRESYSCTPFCERRITLGDTPEFFEATLGQTGNRNQRAVGSVGTPNPR
jgi:hypothetical protein